MIDLLGAFPGWEAIKLTRGHYRSCGKDPHACCVSHLLSEEPVIRSGRGQTYAAGKDTGRYWEAGASNVHWVIVTDNQVEKGIKSAFERVRAPGVFVEGNSFLKFVDADFAIMVARAGSEQIKASARRALTKSDALYLFDPEETNDDSLRQEFIAAWRDKLAGRELTSDLPLYTHRELSQLVARVQSIHLARAA